jgi:hypothetical protein
MGYSLPTVHSCFTTEGLAALNFTTALHVSIAARPGREIEIFWML